jgi:hypothetical protein
MGDGLTATADDRDGRDCRVSRYGRERRTLGRTEEEREENGATDVDRVKARRTHRLPHRRLLLALPPQHARLLHDLRRYSSCSLRPLSTL